MDVAGDLLALPSLDRPRLFLDQCQSLDLALDT